MALSDLIVGLSEFTAIQNTSAQTRAQLLRYLNDSAREIYNTFDLPGSVWDGLFKPEIITAATQLTLPWQVDQIRGVRWSESGRVIGVQGIQRRFQQTPWRQPSLVWRIRGRQPLAKQLTEEGAIVFDMQNPQTETITFTVRGASTTASNVTETVTIAPGQSNGATVTQWSRQGPSEIAKSGITTDDVIIYDVTDVEVGQIGNRQSAAKNILLQLGEFDGYIYDQVCEILFKLPFQSFYYDTDTFLDSDILEQAVLWRAKANWCTLDKSETALQKAAMYAAKCDQLITTVTQNQESEQEMQIVGGFNPYERAGGYTRRNFFATGR